jgi:hypothetical protein
MESEEDAEASYAANYGQFATTLPVWTRASVPALVRAKLAIL